MPVFLLQNEQKGNEEEEDTEGWTSEAKKAFGDRDSFKKKKEEPAATKNQIHLLKLHGSMTQKDRMETFRYKS